MDDPAVQTYRFVRLALVAAMTALLIAVAAAWIGEGAPRGSISAYYYSPARSVFVGALCAIGLSLIALQGRRGGEDILLNVAGLLAPVVAIVPTPVCAGDRTTWGMSSCQGEGRQVPGEFVDGVLNGSWALGITALAAMAVMTVLVRNRLREREYRVGFLASWLLVVAFGVFAVAFRQQYLERAHYVAALGLFGCITVVVLINARRVGARNEGALRGLSRSGFRSAYRVIGVVMVATILAAVAGIGYQAAVGPIAMTYWILVVEVILLVAFVVFWVLQTIENWDTGVPEEVASG